MEYIKNRYPALYYGLNQMTTAGIKRAMRRIEENPSAMLYDGSISGYDKTADGRITNVKY